MIESHDYRLHLDGGTDGTGRMTAPDDDLPALDVAPPPEFGGQGSVWSPEHLFVASVSSCLMTTFRAIADASSLEFVDYSDDPSGHLVRDENRLYRMESVTLRPRVVITNPDKVDKAHRILEKAERACLISRSLEATVQMEPTVQVGAGESKQVGAGESEQVGAGESEQVGAGESKQVGAGRSEDPAAGGSAAD